MGVLRGKIGEGVVLPLGVLTSVPILVKIDQENNATVRVLADGQIHNTDRLTDANRVFFTALHGMQTRSSDEKAFCLSVRLSVCRTRAL